MARPVPKTEAPEWKEPAAPDSLTLHLRLITPLFGGGYEAREVDPVCIIRPAAVRGHLRFWWRALYGGQYASAKELFEAEAAIWGAAATEHKDWAGKVGLRVTLIQKGCSQPCACFEWDEQRRRYRSIPRFRQGYPPYALYPFQGELSDKGRTIKQSPATAYEGVEFVLILTFPAEIREEVLSAVTAWVRYGGIGARTRRGCGSLAVVQTDMTLRIASFADFHMPRNDRIALLPGSQYVLGAPCKSAIEAWQQAVQVYQTFRQGHGFARRPPREGNRPGRSFYPEPDSIRRMTGRYAVEHRPEHPVQKGFPRADLGLPIVFQFKDDGDPPNAVLHSAKERHLRMASPVITKPLATQDGLYRPLVMVLNAPHAWQQDGLVLEVEGFNKALPIGEELVNLSTAELKLIKPLAGKPIRDALLQFVSKQWGNAPIQGWKP